MGLPMARNLLSAGHRLRVFARNPASAATLVGRGAAVFNAPADAAAGADLTILCLPSTGDVQHVLFGDRGIEQGARNNSVVVDCSTISPTAARACAQRLGRNHIHYLDAPIIGDPAASAAAMLTLLLGGKTEAVEQCRPLLQRVAKTVIHVGPSGSGQVARSCNQIVHCVALQGLAEAMQYARAQGVAPERILPALQAGTAAGPVLEMNGSRMAASSYAGGVPAALFKRDLALVVNELELLGLDLPAALLVAGQLHDVVQRGWGGDDGSGLLRLLEVQND